MITPELIRLSMKRFFYLFLILFFLMNNAWGQGVNNLWLMGYDCCSTLFGGINITFQSGNLVMTREQRQMNINATNGIICDRNGNLLFYSNGVYVANSINDTMLNGSGLNPSNFTSSHIRYGLTIPQANLILPFPDDSTKYYLFHGTIDDRFDTYASLYLYYSIIDMNLDNGLGGVVNKNTVLLNDSLVPGRITACKHANGRDWWILVHRFNSALVYEYLITPLGIQGPFLRVLPSIRDVNVGQFVFSPQGDKLAYYEVENDVDICDFDRCTGAFSNGLHFSINDSAVGGGVAFSPSGRYLYVSSYNYIYQYDTWFPSQTSSWRTVGTYSGTMSGGLPAKFYLSSLAPDGKIYVNCINSSFDIHVINYPDSADISCDFCESCIHLPAANAFTIPNHPNYFLGPVTGSVCDSLINGVGTVNQAQATYEVFPNPAREKVYVTTSGPKVKTVQLYTIQGQRMDITFTELKNGEYLEINTALLAPDVYILELMTEREKIVRRVVMK